MTASVVKEGQECGVEAGLVYSWSLPTERLGAEDDDVFNQPGRLYPWEVRTLVAQCY